MKKLLSFIGLLTIASGAFALDGTQIAQASHDVAESKTTHSLVAMTLIDKNGVKDERIVEEWGRKENDLSDTIMVFRAPASVKNTRFLKKENEGAADDKWIYLPALKRVRRIASSDGGSSFMGTDFTYDDMESRDVERDNHELLREETVNGFDCYVVKGVAKDPEDSQYSYRISYIRKDNFVPIKLELFDKANDLEKVMEVQDLREVSGYWTPIKATMTNVQTGHSTSIEIKNIEFDKGVNPKIFTQSFMSSGRA